ncbi:hypothetical protein [Aquabacterium sp.]|uniref:hypothetical protein n=1 Tax=Aquabacterium sp. TaxID=1872578 RepID=UPI00198834C3|nr:hypothetical protein [Aquabacterium sp.]MBC7701787.1 hypothetical protein [Aquabacterium sp.]
MLKSFQALAAEPDSALKPQAANGRDVVQWLKQAHTKLEDARQTAISAGTRMDAAWDAVLMACLAVACAEGWRATSEKGHRAVVLEGTVQALGLSEPRHDELDTLRDWRNRKYRAGFAVHASEVEEALQWVAPFLTEVAHWFHEQHSKLMKQGLAL